jgi:hypothetical protein
MLEKGFPGNTRLKKRQGAIPWLVKCIALFAFLFFVTASPSIVWAQSALQSDALDRTAEVAGINQGADLISIVGTILNVLFGLLGIVLLVIVIYAGYLWMTSGGDATKIENAKKLLRNGIIGLVIILASFAITSFILGLFGDEGGSGGTVSTDTQPGSLGFPGAASALGKGIIEFHIPTRNQTDVARNTSIIITFKEPIKISSLIKDYDDEGTPANLGDDTSSSTTIYLNTDTVHIFQTPNEGESATPLVSEQVRVRFTKDRKTFVFTPVTYLGSSTQNTNYTVALTTGLLREDGRPAFGAAFRAGYRWSFEVSTRIDLDPPKVVSVIPFRPGKYAPNIIIQLNFSEAIDPTASSGIVKDGFTNLVTTARAADKPEENPAPVNGEFKTVNQYRTVEFVTDLSCGTNSCLRTIYCLPSNSAIGVLARAATLGTNPPQALFGGDGFDGIVDVAGNSLDGNGQNGAEGRGKDDYQMSFVTTDKPNLDPPLVQSTTPGMNASHVPLDQVPSADFDNALQASTITSDSVFIKEKEPEEFSDTFWFTPGQVLVGLNGEAADLEDLEVRGRVSIGHRVYLSAPKDLNASPPEYYPYYTSVLQNLYQNCFNPASSPSCQGSPHCCNGKPSSQACPYPLP